jgi:hypothetical protein
MKNISDLQIGKAGEYLNIEGKLLKVQVKTTRNSKHIPQRKTDISAYIFHIGINGSGKNGRQRRTKYDNNQVDIFALVALDTKRIAYIPYFNTQTTMNFRVPELRGHYHDEQGINLKQKVTNLRDKGMSCPKIAEELHLGLTTVYRYSADVSIEQKGTNAGVYFDDFTLTKCLNYHAFK